MKNTSRRQATGLIFAGFISAQTLLGVGSLAAAATRGVVFKSPSCGCCNEWVKVLRRAGINLEVKDVESLSKIKKMLQVPGALQSCHTAIIGNYVVEGHVPVREIKRLLDEKPKATGIAVPGMPIGSPGMEQGGRRDSYQVFIFQDGGNRVFAEY